MARLASNYRQARRAAWKALNKEGVNGFVPWTNFNSKAGYGIGTKRSEYAGGAHFLGGRSKYMPHIGKKQRAKGAARAA